MKKLLGIIALLVAVCVFTAFEARGFLTESNVENLMRRSAEFGVISIGAAFVIITGGIDLSIGSVICLVGCLTPYLIKQGWAPDTTMLFVLGLCVAIGLIHGLLITKLDLQPFVVTLCGLLLYRGLTRTITEDQNVGFGQEYAHLRWPAMDKIAVPWLGWEERGVDGARTEAFGIPVPVVILAGIAVVAAIFLRHTVWGRYLFALGRNEEAARFSGIRTDRLKIVAYIVCSLLAGIGGLLFVFEVGSAHAATTGNFYELWAIAGAVLGGCALRGGEGSILGVVLGATLMQTLRNSITLVRYIPSQVEYVVIGAVILAGVAIDALVKRLR